MKDSVGSLIRSSSKLVSKHLPGILTAMGLGGMLGSVLFAVKATPKAVKLIEKRKEELEVDKLGVIETVKTAGPCYIPTAATFAISTACILCGSHEHARRNAALATAYSLSETALKEYQDKVIEVIGPDKEKEIQKEILKDKIEANPVPMSGIPHLGDGEALCYDPYSGRYFYCSPDKAKEAIMNLGFQQNQDMFVSLSDYYDFIGLSHTEISGEMGWNIEKGVIRPDFEYIAADNGPPIWALKIYPAPRHDYYHC